MIIKSHLDLFHATRRVFYAGEVVVADTQTHYYPEVLAMLEQHRPNCYPSRSICVFAADSAAASTKFLLSEPGVKADDIRVYRVHMNHYHRAPFRVIHELNKRIKSAGAVNQLIDEYWQPKQDWVFWEYFCGSFSVIEETKRATHAETYAFGIRYLRDVDLSATL
jgi:hypothetical protein